MDSNPQRPRDALTDNLNLLSRDFLATEMRVAADILFPPGNPYRSITTSPTPEYLQELLRGFDYGQEGFSFQAPPCNNTSVTTSTVPQEGNLTATALVEKMREEMRKLSPAASEESSPYTLFGIPRDFWYRYFPSKEETSPPKAPVQLELF
jgi:hypothetical protein